jgi:hypothetical protein
VQFHVIDISVGAEALCSVLSIIDSISLTFVSIPAVLFITLSHPNLHIENTVYVCAPEGSTESNILYKPEYMAPTPPFFFFREN